MDFYGESAIDRAFAPESHSGPHGAGAMQDLSNSTAPLPRKRPTAKPAANTAAPSGSARAPSDSPAEPTSPASNYIHTPQTQQRSPTSAKNGGTQQSLTPEQADNMAQIQELRQQLAEAPTDPAQQAQMMARMTGLMTELQNMISQMTRGMNGAPTPTGAKEQPIAAAATTPQVSAPQPQAQQQQRPPQFSRPAGYPGFFGGDNEPHTPSSVSEHDMHMGHDAQAGLRSTAKPFEPHFGGGSNGGRQSGFDYRGGQQQQRYAAVSAMSNPYGSVQGNMWSNNAAPRAQGCVICFVEFKRGRMKRYESDVFIAPGNYIIVEGDRGEDCGLVVHTFQRLPDGSTGRQETLEGVSIDTGKVKPETGRVRRVANAAEVERLHGEIATLERHALKACRERVEGMGLEMNVVDCEYQFDRKKITFFFDSSRAIDFRELTKDLFKQFGARIWLENINSKVKNVVPDGALSHADKLLYAERGLRPPRR